MNTLNSNFTDVSICLSAERPNEKCKSEIDSAYPKIPLNKGITHYFKKSGSKIFFKI